MNPGDVNGLRFGCICDVEANDYGAGRRDDANGVYTTVFVITETCPLHGYTRWATLEQVRPRG